MQARRSSICLIAFFLCAFALSIPTIAAADGALKIKYEPTEEEDFERYEEMLKKSGLLEDIAEEINEELKLPTDITIVVKDGDGPLYDGDAHEIVMNYEFMADIEEMLEANEYAKSPKDLDEFILDVVEVVTFHEIGHALIHTLELPVTGKEEDSADTLATIITLIRHEEDHGAEVAETAADLFLMMAEEREGEPEEEDFWDEHSLDEQRFTSMICLIYGSNPEANARLLESKMMPESAAERCPETFEEKSDAWLKLLEPHEK